MGRKMRLNRQRVCALQLLEKHVLEISLIASFFLKDTRLGRRCFLGEKSNGNQLYSSRLEGGG